MDSLTSNRMLLLILAASGCMYLFLNVRPGSYCWWLQLQHRGGLTGVCVAAVARQVAHCVKRMMFSSIRLESHLEDVFQEPWLVVET
jgi:hypothetical protein